MAECQSSRVEGLTGRGLRDALRCPPLSAGDPPTPSATVHRIPHDRVAHVLQMEPDLVGAPGLELQPKQVDHVKPSHYPGIGGGRSTARRHHHPLPVGRMPSHMGVDAQRAFVQMAPPQGGVGSPHSARGYGSCQPAMSQIGFGNDHETGRVPIQAVDDARAALGSPGQGGPSSHQCIDQGVVPVARGGMDHQSRRFVDDSQMFVFEDDGERNGPWLQGSRWFVAREANGDRVTAREYPRSSGRLSSNTD